MNLLRLRLRYYASRTRSHSTLKPRLTKSAASRPEVRIFVSYSHLADASREKPWDWKNTKAARFKQLPRDWRAVTDWRSADHACLDVTVGIRRVVKDIRRELEAQAAGAAARSRARKAAARIGRKATPKASPVPKPPKASTKRQEARPKPGRGPARSTRAGKATPETRRVRRPR